MKDEFNGEIIEQLVDLRVKIYSLKTTKEQMKKAKGVKKNVVKKDISHVVKKDIRYLLDIRY